MFTYNAYKATGELAVCGDDIAFYSLVCEGCIVEYYTSFEALCQALESVKNTAA